MRHGGADNANAAGFPIRLGKREKPVNKVVSRLFEGIAAAETRRSQLARGRRLAQVPLGRPSP